MNAKFLLSLTTTFLLSTSAFASIAYIDNSDYRCSDGKTYDVLRLFEGGWGPGAWSLVALCEQGILSQDSYNGRYGRYRPIKESHPEVAKCMDQDTSEVRSCYQEFIDNNGEEGPELPELKHFDGVVGETCGDRVPKARAKVEEYREINKSLPGIYSEEDMREVIRAYSLAVKECSEDDGHHPPKQKVIQN